MGIQWSLVVFTALTGIGGGMFFFMAFDELRGRPCKAPWMCWVAIVLIAIGGVASMTHLPHPERAFGVMNRPMGSIFTEAALTGITAVIVFVYWLFVRKDRDSKSPQRVFAVLGMVFGVLLAFMSGHSYMMASRPAWDTLLIPLGYWATAFSGGSALYLLCLACSKKTDREGLAKGPIAYVCIMAVVALVIDLVYVCSIGVVGDASFAGAVWGLLMVPGIVAIVCSAIAVKFPAQLPLLSVLACISAVLTAFGIRILMWLAINVDVVTMFPLS